MTQPSLKDLTTRVDQHLRNARFIGKLSVDMAQKKLQEFCATSHDSSSKDVDTPTVVVATTTEAPIENYDALTAKEIVASLTGLSPAQLLAVFNYENARRQRRTILKAASSGNE
jgi:hypothetical protein